MVSLLMKFLQRLRFPWLFGIVLALFAADLVIPDVIPLADEALLGAGALLLGAWRKRIEERREEVQSGDRALVHDAESTGDA